MPLQKISLRPGVSRESTDLANEGGWYACDKIRFRSGSPENIGGWTPITSDTFLGVCRNLTEWESLSTPGVPSFLLLGVGTNIKFYLLNNQTFYDITPFGVITEEDPATRMLGDPFLPIFSQLASTITSTATDIPLVSGATFIRCFPLVIRIGSEDIYAEYVSGNTLTGCIRGYNGTTAAGHTSGTNVTSSWVVANCPANLSGVGNYVNFVGASAIPAPYTSALINGDHLIKAQTTNYVAFDTGVQSTSATAFGGLNTVGYFEIAIGASEATSGTGWGAGVWTSIVYGAGLTALNGLLNSSATTITVTSTTTFPAAGYLIIESEVIQYTGTTSTTFTGCVRGVSGGNATSHMSATTVRQAVYPGSLPVRYWNTPAETGVNIPLRLWSSDTFGQDLVMNIRDNAVFYWSKNDNMSASGSTIDLPTLPSATVWYPNGHAVNMASATFGADAWAPTVGARVVVTDERHIVVLGTNDAAVTSTAQDPMLIRWCEQEDPLVWEPTQTNTAGFQRLTYGSKLITAEKTRQEILIWSDTALFSMRYLGPPYTFGFNTISAEISIASPNAMITANNITYWMGLDKFYAYSGRVDTLPCSLRQYIFDDINLSQLDQVYAGTAEKYNEVWWFYCSSSSTQLDRYAVYNYLEKIWYYGQLPRSAWYDSHIRTYPIATEGGVIYYQDYGIDDATDPANPVAIPSYIESANFDLGEGDHFAFVKRIIPDIDFIGSTHTAPVVTLTVSVRNYPGQGSFQASTDENVQAAKVSLQVYNYTNQEWIRLRGRQVAFKISSDTLGVKWQNGLNRLDIQPDGRR